MYHRRYAFVRPLLKKIHTIEGADRQIIAWHLRHCPIVPSVANITMGRTTVDPTRFCRPHGKNWVESGFQEPLCLSLCASLCETVTM